MPRKLTLYLIVACLSLLTSVSWAKEEIPQTRRPCTIHSVALKTFSQADVIHIQADAPIERWHDFVLRSPERIAVDLYGCESQSRLTPTRREGRFIRLLRIGRHRNKVRVAGNIREGAKIQRYLRKQKDGLAIYISRPKITFLEEIRTYIGTEDGLTQIVFATNRKYAAKPKITTLTQPNRLVFDLPSTFPVADLPRKIRVVGTNRMDIKVGIHPSYTRLVFDLGSQPLPRYQFLSEPEAILVTLQTKRQLQPEITPETGTAAKAIPAPEGKDVPSSAEQMTGIATDEDQVTAAPMLDEEKAIEEPWGAEAGEEPWAEETAEEPWEEVEEGSRFQLYGRLWNKLAHDTKEDNPFEDDAYNHAELILGVKYVPNPKFQAVLSMKADYFFYVNDGDWRDDSDIRFHDTYLNFAGSSFNLKLGNQIVRWGKTDEVSPLDNLNPEDLRDGFPRRRDERKLPIPMVNLELFKEMYKLQAIFIPFFVESKFDLRDTDWAYFDHIAKKVGPFGIQEEHVSDTLSNSEVGVRFSGTIGTLDYGFSYQYAREDLPSLGSFILPPGFPSAPSDTDLKDLAQFAQFTNQPIVLENNRRNIYGFEFETVLGSFGLRGDVAYIYQRNFLNDRLKSIRKPVIEYVLGADYNGPGSFYFNLQFVQAIILNYDHGIIANDEITTGIDGEIYKRFFDDNITLDLRFFHNITDNAYYYNPNILFEYWENVSLELGLDLIGGPTYTTIGYFRDNDQVYGILRVHF